MKTIKVNPYGVLLHLIVNEKEFAKVIKAKYDADHKMGCDGLEFDGGDGNIYIGIFRHNDISVLAHECGHACLDIAKRVDMGYIPGNQEQFTYLLGWMIETCTDAYPNQLIHHSPQRNTKPKKQEKEPCSTQPSLT